MSKQTSAGKLKSNAHRDTLRDIRAYRLHSADQRRIVSAFYLSLGSPVALSCELLYRNGEFKQLVEKEIDPRQYTDAHAFQVDFAAISFLRKNTFLKTGINLRGVALATFEQGELGCKASNHRLRRLSSPGIVHRDDWSVINLQIRKIERLLKDFDIDELLKRSGWGPGTSLGVKGDDTSSSRKFDVEVDVTLDAYRLFGEILRKAYPTWENLTKVNFVAGNAVITVPKNAKTDRTIAVEPGLNLWLQLGIGKMLRRRLKRAGYNLDKDLKNQKGAYQGSLDDSLATIDFKAASDSISCAVVELLLPPKWYSVLDAARSKRYTLQGTTHWSEKFSTMGNGFTFELESLIFVTLALAICESRDISTSGVSIFGDDLILPPECVPQLARICTLYGFTINASKSFSSGNFRESCGAYYFKGYDVKPIFLKDRPLRLKDVYRLANRTRILAHRFALRQGCDGRFKGLWYLIVSFVPKKLQYLGPEHAGDAVIAVNPSETNARPHKDGWEGFSFPAIPSVAVQVEKDSQGLLLARLHSPSRELPLGNFDPLRKQTRIALKYAMFCRLWYDYGPWIS